MLLRVKYVSRFARPLSPRDVDAIVTNAQRRNAPLGITGVLLAFGEVFMQILEGPLANVPPVLARIERDPRHRDLVVIRRQEVELPLFGGWSMRLVELGDDARREARPMLEMIESIAEGTAPGRSALHDLDDMIWRTLGQRGTSVRRTG
jgi:adenylate cyclase